MVMLVTGPSSRHTKPTGGSVNSDSRSADDGHRTPATRNCTEIRGPTARAVFGTQWSQVR